MGTNGRILFEHPVEHRAFDIGICFKDMVGEVRRGNGSIKAESTCGAESWAAAH